VIDDLLEVVVELWDALDVATTEFEMIEEADVPLPGKLLDELEQRVAMSRTLEWLLSEEQQPQLREAVQAKYREEFARATRTDDVKGHVSEEARERLRHARELVRRRRLLVPELRDAIEGVPWG
jgi:post-segregation antitoxin (ccd killing protein)